MKEKNNTILCLCVNRVVKLLGGLPPCSVHTRSRWLHPPGGGGVHAPRLPDNESTSPECCQPLPDTHTHPQDGGGGGLYRHFSLRCWTAGGSARRSNRLANGAPAVLALGIPPPPPPSPR